VKLPSQNESGSNVKMGNLEPRISRITRIFGKERIKDRLYPAKAPSRKEKGEKYREKSCVLGREIDLKMFRQGLEILERVEDFVGFWVKNGVFLKKVGFSYLQK